ncbi:NAD(P)/FAD-dependent oxidoreductase [Streptomyces sp. ISL-44]|uniref:NAD(P)/FAD-dependent oxidoreductase n=1 Tax=Streptomyces sp. ISL-44 TaxID=2819184 RepID=UPI001BEB2A46|nr:NAD(P)/FAD-dependent oxidoreductase [Streptomyces sp. ISL-44]MBT2546482.1 NAD(P)/FAD-dependent oxidoreductase [Streptomyces sp. ISL-44]
MTNKTYDAIVVGARCAGAPTAMLLARRGHRVLLVDRARFPSDTVSTHLIHPPGLAALDRWGLLSRVTAGDLPEITTYSFGLGPLTLAGSPAWCGFSGSYAPRRTVLDKILVDAASEAGVEVREAFSVEELVTDGEGTDGTVTGIRGREHDGPQVTEHAQVVVGADGAHSFVARTVGAASYAEKPKLQASYYTYWSGLGFEHFEAFLRPDRAFAGWPTNDGLTLLICGRPMREAEAHRADAEAEYLTTIALAPSLAERTASATRVERLVGTAVPNYFRTPYGPGWALVGDAGYLKDFITAQGIQDAFQDAELCARAVDETLTGQSLFAEAMRDYQEARDARVQEMYEFTADFAQLDPPTPQMQQMFGAIAQRQEAMDGFARVIAGVTAPSAFFSDPALAPAAG